jgi:hypothetical protein
MGNVSKPVEKYSPTTEEALASQWWHGATGLAKELDVPVRRARYLLEQDVVPGAKKVAGRWMGLRHRLPEMVSDNAA